MSCTPFAFNWYYYFNKKIKLMIVVYRKRVSSTFSHIFTHFYTFFHIFPSPSLHFPNSCHKLNYSKEKLGNPQTLLMDFLILNLKPFVSESSKKGSASKYFPKAAITSKYFPKKAVFTKSLNKIVPLIDFNNFSFKKNENLLLKLHLP